MGQKVLLAGSAVSIFACLGYTICLFLPFCKIYWHTAGGFVDVFFMTIFTMKVHYLWTKSSVCWIVKKLSGKRDLCDKDENGDSAATGVLLQDSQSTWCATGFNHVVTGGCPAMQCAYIMGIVLILFVVVNIIMQGVGLFLIQQYTKKPKKQYRETAFFLNLIGGILMLIAAVLYWPTTIMAFEGVELLGGVGGLVLSKSDGVAASYGYFLMYFFIIFQGVSILLLANGSNSKEAREAELREQKKFMQEQELFYQATEMTATGYGQNVGVSAPPNHWGQSWSGAMPAQAAPSYGYGYGGPPQPMPAAMPSNAMPSNMMPSMASVPQGPYF